MKREEGVHKLIEMGMTEPLAVAHMDLVDAVNQILQLDGPMAAIEACKHAALTVMVTLGVAEWLPEDEGEPN